MHSQEPEVGLTPENASDDLLHLKRHYQVAFLVIFFFISGLMIVHSYKRTPYDLSTHYFQDLSIEDRQRCSFYNWCETRAVRLDFIPSTSGMLTIRANNGEIFFLTFAESGVAQSVDFELPTEIQEVFIHSQGGIESFAITEESLAANGGDTPFLLK
jgi:hypothetical protein